MPARPPTIANSWRRAAAGLHVAWAALLWASLRLVPWVILVFLGLLLWNLLAPPRWHFSVDARTAVAEVELPREFETNWRIEGAILCSRAASLGTLPRHTVDGPSPCGSRRWFAYRLAEAADGVADEQVLVLGGDSGGRRGETIAATIEVRTDGGLQLSLRAGGGSAAAKLRGSAGAPDVAAALPLNLVWQGESRPRDLVFPFTARRVRVGRDVTWAESSALRDGSLTVFTGSDESVAKRVRVEEVALMLGDQVRLEKLDDAETYWPKGFFRFDRIQGAEHGPVLEAVAFGRAERVRIERFGDAGYDFEPGWWVGVQHDRRLVSWTGFMIGLLGLLGTYAGMRELAAAPLLSEAFAGLAAASAGDSDGPAGGAEPAPHDEGQGRA